MKRLRFADRCRKGKNHPVNIREIILKRFSIVAAGFCLAIFFTFFLAGCASPDYKQYALSTEAASVARSQALAEIAKAGDTAAVAATMALALGASQSQLQAPQPNQVLQWASVLVPGLVQAYGIKQNASVAINASNNAAATSQATTAGFVGIAGLIQAAPTITTTTDRHDVINPAPVVITPVTPIVPTVITPVITPVIQATQ